MNKRYPIIPLLCALLLLVSRDLTSSAQPFVKHVRSANAYRNNYQRFATGNSSNFSFEIRNGTLWAWGENFFGQLGDGTTIHKSSPVPTGSGNNWVSIASGSYHSLGLKSDGTLWAWGSNSFGQFGDGSRTDKISPIQIVSQTDVLSIMTRTDFCGVIKSDRKSICMTGDGAGGCIG